MTRYIKFTISLLTLLAAAIAPAANAANVTLKATLDSAYIIMGKQTALHLEIIEPDNVEGRLFLPDTAWNTVEVAKIGDPDTTGLGSGRRQILDDIILQSFDSGLYTLPPVLYIVGNETIASNRPVLKVLPVAVDSMLTVHDYEGVSDVDRSILDYMPDWMSDYGIWILLALVVIAGGIYVYLKWIRKGQIPLVPAKKPLPPYEVAMQALNKLKDDKLCERGLEKEYYTRLTDILRNYLDTRFGINAMEMTSPQILRALQENEHTKLSRKYMSQVLEIADFVKFAKVRPLPDDNVQAFKSALQFVEDTKPAPEAEGKESDLKSDSPEAKSEQSALKENKAETGVNDIISKPNDK